MGRKREASVSEWDSNCIPLSDSPSASGILAFASRNMDAKVNFSISFPLTTHFGKANAFAHLLNS